ncbi:MAG: extensin family protein [Rhizobiaceae bacterium]|nr:extensin family protein [Rhizobiaceae bacterium]
MLVRIRSGRVSARGGLGVAAVLASVALIASACSTDNVLEVRPDVDLGVRTAAVSMRPVAVEPEPAPVVAREAPLLSEPAPDGAYGSPLAGDAATFTPEPQEAFQSAPVVSDPNQSAASLGEMFEPAPAGTVQQVGYVAPADPMGTPSGGYSEPPAAGPGRMSSDEVDCRRELKRLGVSYEDIAPIDDGGVCRIDHPVKLKAIGSVRMQPAATLRCEMALTVARWTKKELVPAARTRYLTGVKAIHQASSYSCRKIARSRTMSEHAKGNALDIARIELNSGRDIEIEKKGLFAFRQKGLLNNVRSDACEYFSTVLGPGYNHDHRDHFHFDIKPRRNTACH